MSEEVGDTEFGVQVGIGFVGRIVTAIVGLVGSIVVARIVGASGYGIFYISVAIADLFENPVSGWATACKKRMTETDFDDSEALGSVLAMMAVTAVVLGPLSVLGLHLVTENPIIPLAVPVIFVGSAIYWSLSTLLTGRRNFSMAVWSGTAKTVAETAGKVLLVVAGFGVWGMVGGRVLASVLVVPLLLYFIGVRPAVPSRATLKSIWGYARWSIPQSFVGTALSKMDTILLGWLVVASAAGKYQVGLKLTMPAVLLSSVVQSGLMGRVSNLESRDAAWEDDLWNALSYASVLAIPIFFGSLVLGEELAITVFSGDFSGAGVFVVGLALYRVFDTQQACFGSVLNGMDRPDVAFRISLAGFVLNVLAGVGLWYVMGAVGIVVATAATAAVLYVATVLAARRYAGVDTVVTPVLATEIAAGAVMALVVWALKDAIGIGHWTVVPALIGVGGLVYGGLLLAVSHHVRTTMLGIYADFRRAYV